MEPLELVIKVLVLTSLTMLKFLAAPLGGYAAGLPMWLTILITIAGMMIAAVLFTYVGDYIRDHFFGRFFKQTKTFSKKRRMMINVFRKFGPFGVAFLTPVLFTPIPGTLLLVSFKTPNYVIFKNMLISAVFWSFVFCGLIYHLGPKAIELFTF